MSAVRLLGTITGVTESVLQLANRKGDPKDVALEVAKGAVVVAAEGPAKEALTASIAHLEGRGTLREALKAHLPNLPERELAVALSLIDGLTEAVADDGQLDAGEIMALVGNAIREYA